MVFVHYMVIQAYCNGLEVSPRFQFPSKDMLNFHLPLDHQAMFSAPPRVGFGWVFLTTHAGVYITSLSHRTIPGSHYRRG
jgi:hypothetical protein